MRYTIAIDISRCSGCGSCFLACKDEHIGNDYAPLSAAQPRHGHRWLDIKEVEQGEDSKVKVDYIPIMCQHCKEPACAKTAPEGAVITREDGPVLFDPEKTVGRRDIMENCPYGAVYWNEEKNIPQKCGMCAHMLDGGAQAPRCVEACPTNAMFFGDIDDPESEISKYVAVHGDFTALYPEMDAKPSVLYRELPAPFITGEVMLEDAPEACCEGAGVSCKCECGDICKTETDFMGDFQFKGLKEGGRYTMTVSYPGYESAAVEITADKARDMGVIVLKKL